MLAYLADIYIAIMKHRSGRELIRFRYHSKINDYKFNTTNTPSLADAGQQQGRCVMVRKKYKNSGKKQRKIIRSFYELQLLKR